RVSSHPAGREMRRGAIMTTLPTVSFSHFGLYVTDLPRMEDFYARVLGLLVSDRGKLPGGSDLVFLSRDPDEHHQLVLATGRPPCPQFKETEALCRNRPGFVSRAEWRKSQVARMGG